MNGPIKYFSDEAVSVALASARTHGNMRVTLERGNIKIISTEGMHNRLMFMNRFVFPGARLFMANVQHGNKVVVVNGTTDEPLFEADGFVTARRKSFIGVTFADCPPVILTGLTPKGHPVAGLAHSGSKPTLKKISPEAVEKMTLLGAQRRSIRAIIGPGICYNCYEYGSEAPEVFKNYPEFIRPKFASPKFFVDLPGIIRYQLLEAGLKGKNIFSFSPCTYENRFLFSARRDNAKPLKAGMVVVGIR